MFISMDAQRNKCMHLENTLVMYGIYNAETLEKLIKTVHTLHHMQSLYESLFAGQTSAAYKAYSLMHGACGIQHYAVNSMLYLHTIKNKYIKIYNKFISQLHIYSKAVGVLAKGYLPILLVTPLKLQEILALDKETLIKTNPDYDIGIHKYKTSGVSHLQNNRVQILLQGTFCSKTQIYSQLQKCNIF